jgi:hypothetical protein
MAAPHGRIEPGQPLESAISARAWNRAQDAADIVFGAGAGQSAAASRISGAPYVALPCKNLSPDDVPQFGLLKIYDLEILPTGDNVSQFRTRPVLRCNSPDGTDARHSRIAIAVEPIKSQCVGMVAVSGVVQAKINIVDNTHWFAVPQYNNVQQLKTHASYGHRILWKSFSTGSNKWALVLVNNVEEQTIRLGRISNAWSKGDTKLVTPYDGFGNEIAGAAQFEAINRFATIETETPIWVACHRIDDIWHLIAAEC